MSRRFTCDDQVHTTGTDIKQAPNAVACLTLSKDMVFRDYAQGAYRMRGIRTGQRINVLVVPEVEELIHKELHALPVREQAILDDPHLKLLEDVSCWLTLRAVYSEVMQEIFLMQQDLANTYRRNSLLNELLPMYLEHGFTNSSLEARTQLFTLCTLPLHQT